MQKYKWPLCADVFTFLDKVKIFKFLLTERIWTYGEWVVKYEKMWEEFLDNQSHVVMVSSGSTANELIALRRKWELEQTGEWPRRNKVVAPCNTWISSVSCWINIGYEVIFTDVSPANLNMTSTHLKEIFEKDINKEIGTVFYTALLGFFGDLNECKRLTEEHGARFLMDNCEATLSAIGLFPNKVTDLLNFSTCSTSLFYSHFSTSGTEGGLVICEDEDEANFYRMMRSHGLTRGMPEKYKNPKVSPEFDFALMGSNYRSSNLQAYMALLDFKRSIKYSIRNRFSILNEFYLNIDRGKFDNFWQEERGVVTPLALPIICKTDELKIKAELYCKSNGIMTRPIIGGVLCEHTAFKGKCDSNDYPIALNAHRRGFYIGLNKNVTKKMAKELALELNQL